MSDETNDSKPRGPLAAALKRVAELEAELQRTACESPAATEKCLGAAPLSLADFAPQAVTALMLSGKVQIVDGDNPYGCSIGLANYVYSAWRTYVALTECPADIAGNANAFQDWLLAAKKIQQTAWATEQNRRQAVALLADQHREAARRAADRERLEADVEATRTGEARPSAPAMAGGMR